MNSGLMLKKLLKKNHISMGKLAMKSGLNTSTISRLANNKYNILTTRQATFNRIAKALNIDPLQFRYILSGEVIPNGAIKEDGPSRRLPVIGQIACGNPIDAIKTTGTYKVTDTIGLPSGINYWLKCEGNSMFPTITNGSYVLIHQQSIVGENRIAAVQMRDKYDDRPDVTLKRVVKQNKHIIVLKPDNSHYDPIILTKDNPGRIIGRAIRVEHDL